MERKRGKIAHGGLLRIPSVKALVKSGLVAGLLIMSAPAHAATLLGNGTLNVADDLGVFMVRTTPVPEPSTALLFAFGLVGLAVRRRRAAENSPLIAVPPRTYLEGTRSATGEDRS